MGRLVSSQGRVELPVKGVSMRLLILGLVASTSALAVPASASVLVHGARLGAAAASALGIPESTQTSRRGIRGIPIAAEIAIAADGSNSRGALLGRRGGAILAQGVTATDISVAAVSGVPEPATWAMMLLGFGAVGYGLRRRKPGFAQLA